MALPPGPRRPPVVQMLDWSYRPAHLLSSCAHRFGDAFSLRMPTFGTFVVLSAPAAIKEVFTGDARVLHAGKGNRLLEPVVGPSSVLLLDGAEHMRQRKLLLPPFHGERMVAYGQIMRDSTEAQVARWRPGEPFSAHSSMQAITLDVILHAVFGLEDPRERGPVAEPLARFFTPPPFVLAFLPFLQRDFPGSPFRAFMRLREETDRLIYRVIRERRAAPDAESRSDILSLLLGARDEEGRPMTDAELRDELVTLLAAGHETTATALSWALHYLLSNPAAKDHLVAELSAAAPLDPVKIKQLPYLDAVVKEVLRLQPIVPIVAREAQSDVEIAGWSIPRGTIIAPCAYLTHRRADVYSEPERFLPERFLDRKIDPYEWLPFGGGIRRCIGMAFAQYEMAIVLATLLSSVDLERAPGPPPRTARRSVTLAPSDGTRVVMRGCISATDRSVFLSRV
jgi:cytochrome P450 family 110